jgi:hypothetical protein
MEGLSVTRQPILYFSIFVLFTHLTLLNSSSQQGNSYIPETGQWAVYQNALELQKNLNVLSISIKPGYEDLASLAYLRYERGANILSVYITNGEAESAIEYPYTLASKKRKEASRAISYIGGKVYFLSFPDIISALDSFRVRQEWQSDSIRYKLMKVISEYKPDIIIVARDLEIGKHSLLTDIVRSDLLETVRNLNATDNTQFPSWNVERVLVDDSSLTGYQFPVKAVIPIYKKTSAEIGHLAEQYYESNLPLRGEWNSQSKPKYSLIYSRVKERKISLTKLNHLSEKHLIRIENKIVKLTSDILKKIRQSTIGTVDKNDFLIESTQIMKEIDEILRAEDRLRHYELRTLIGWQHNIDKLRNTLLDIKVYYTLSDSILCNRQLTYFRVDSISGYRRGDKLLMIIPDVEKGWIINEDNREQIPLTLGETFRLISPQHSEYTYPDEIYGLDKNAIGKTLQIFILSSDSSMAKRFIYTINLPLHITPRFTAEVMTPIVRYGSRENIIVKLTNHSRDGMSDYLSIDDTIVTIERTRIFLNKKDSTALLSIPLVWNKNPSAEENLVTLSLGGIHVANFAVRKFEVRADINKRIGLLSKFSDSPVSLALTRIGFNKVDLLNDIPDPSLMDSLDVLIVDSPMPQSTEFQLFYNSNIERFLEKGGHVIILEQSAADWNKTPLIQGIYLNKTSIYDTQLDVEIDSNSSLVNRYNVITSVDFDDWIFAKSKNRILINNSYDYELPIRVATTGDPLLISNKIYQRKITYVGLALNYQLMNINPGAHKILSNIISH